MDAYQQQNRFMRPPPPSTADPHYPHHLQQQQQQPPRQPGPWFPNQFQYHPSHSPSPPPPPPPQWPPHSDHLNPPQSSAYPPPPHHYSHQNQFPPPHRLYLPPPPPHPHSQVPQGYSQEWGNPNWGNHHQAYPVHNNGEDWAARAKAWATAKTAMDNQHPQSQFSPASRPEEQGQYNEQYPQTVDSHYSEMVPHSVPASSYQQYPVTSLNRPPVGHLQDPGPYSYAPDGHAHFTTRNGSVAGDSNAAFSHEESLQSPSAHQQEVPSSYSSVTGNEQFADRNNHPHSSMSFPTSSAHEGQYHAQSSAMGRSTLANQPYAYGSQSADLQPDLSDQPLDFAPRFNRDHDPQVHAGYSHSDVGGHVRGVDPVATMPSIHSWAPPIAPGYPPVPPVLPSGPQHDPSMAVPSPGSVHSVTPFGGFGGPSFQPAIPSAGTPYSLGVGNALHATTLFPSDAYGISGVSERPKKAPVPNWLREEIIKKKAVITSSSHEHLKEETPSNEDEGVDRSIGKGDQGDSRSIESSRSTEEEDDDEDYVEAARTAAINSEIKRVLTEVLLKVTDELFDEIATKVLSEDDQMIDVDHKTVMSNHKVSPSPPAVPTPKASAKVLIPIKAKETNTETVNGKANSITPGDLLGLANYASDEDDEEDEIESSRKPNSRTNSAHMQSGTGSLSEDTHDAIENGSSQVEKDGGGKKAVDSSNKISIIESNNSHNGVSNDLSGSRDSKEMVYGNGIADAMHSSEISGDKDKKNNVDEKLYGTNRSSSKDVAGEKIVMKSERSSGNVDVSKLRDDPRGKETRIKSDKNDRHESKRSSSGKDYKETESGKIRSDEKGEENRRRQDEKDIRKDQTDDRNGSKHRMKEQGVRTGEKAKESESRKRSTHLGVKEERKEKERAHKTSAKEDGYKKRERGKDEDRSRKKLDSSRHKRRRSSSDSSRGRNSKDTPVDQSNDSSDETSDDSRRKLHSRKRNLSPSPVRSRRRQVSRSPHSKHSQRRHSPYSSLETTRGRRSRSKSPVRRQR